MAADPTRSDGLENRLRDFLTRQQPGLTQLHVTGLHRSSAGASRENWPFELSWQEEGRPRSRQLLLRRDPDGEVVHTDRTAEFRLLKALEDTPVPAPIALSLDESGIHLLRPGMIVQRHSGRTHRSMLRSTDPLKLGLEGRVHIAQQLCEVLASLHMLDVTALGIDGVLARPTSRSVEHELLSWEKQLDEHELEPQPALRMALGWLRDNAPDSPRQPVLVHGDFRPANVLVNDEGELEVLLDWEMAHLGDPLDDVGWYCAPLYSREHFVPGAWESTDFLARYSELTGVQVSRADLRYWQVMATFRLGIIALTSVKVFCNGRADRPPAPAAITARHVAAALLDAVGSADGRPTIRDGD